MRSTIRRQLAGGESESDVKNYFVIRYGEWILLSPPASGIGLLAWISPPLLIAVGLLALAFALVRWQRNRRLNAVDTSNFTHEDVAAIRDAFQRRLADGEAITMPPIQSEPEKDSQPRRSPTQLWVAGVLAGAFCVAALISLAYSPEMKAGVSSQNALTPLMAARQAVRTHPRSAQAWTVLGNLELRGGQTKRAVKAFQTAIRVDPAFVGARLDVSFVLIAERQARAALKVLRPVQQGKRSVAEVWLLEGLAHQALKQNSGAIADFREFLRLAPHNADVSRVRKWIHQLERRGS